MATPLLAGLVLIGTRAEAGVVPILNNAYDITSSQDPTSNTCFVVGVDNEFNAGGVVTGIGTAAQVIRVDYGTGLPTNASRSNSKISVKQTSFSTLSVTIDKVNVTGDVLVDDCSISGSVNANKLTGSVSTKCSGNNLFGGLTANQAASVQAAFNGSKTVTFKVNNSGKWSLKIKCSGDATLAP